MSVARPRRRRSSSTRAEIDAVNERVYADLNNGVYRAGFATTQEAYEIAAGGVFDTLDWLEERLAGRRFLVGGAITEADIRLFTTLVRFDAVYHGHFKCNRRALVAYPALWAYTRDLYQHPAIRPTVDLAHVKGHYYGSHPWLNPSRIVPIGPDRDFDAPSGRDRLSRSAAWVSFGSTRRWIAGPLPLLNVRLPSLDFVRASRCRYPQPRSGSVRPRAGEGTGA